MSARRKPRMDRAGAAQMLDDMTVLRVHRDAMVGAMTRLGRAHGLWSPYLHGDDHAARFAACLDDLIDEMLDQDKLAEAGEALA
jgi:hypothetical protein